MRYSSPSRGRTRCVSRTTVPLLGLILCLVLYGGTITPAQDAQTATDRMSTPRLIDETLPFTDQLPAAIPPLNYVPKKPGHYTAEDWKTAIDTTWGPGLPAATKSNIWLTFWRAIDWDFAAFHNLPLDWDSVDNVYGSTHVDYDTISRGRFHAMLMRACMALRESHTIAIDLDVFNAEMLPGVPLAVVGAYGNNNHFGAGLTPLEDSSLLVYRVHDPHPLGLVPGDIVLGYDGIPWNDLYKELIAAELPIGWTWWGASPRSFAHSWLKTAGMNWHLFDTIDVVRYSTGDTVHLATSALVGQEMTCWASEQLEVPGITPPGGSSVRYGIIEGTHIGYIAVQAAVTFQNAVAALMDSVTAGLIIDLRLNFGGNWPAPAHPSLSLLFNETVDIIGIAQRSNPLDHLAMGPSFFYPDDESRMEMDSTTFYGKPIAVLTGPGCWSAGDYLVFHLSAHPRVRFFGKPSTSTYSPFRSVELHEDFYFRHGDHDAYRRSDSTYLAHLNFPDTVEYPGLPYEDVWLTPDNVAAGIDDVVEAAKAWITMNDGDQDGTPDTVDNCEFVFNPTQVDTDSDLVGDSCDNCPEHYNPLQEDSDDDGIGDSCACWVVVTGDVDTTSAITSGDIISLVGYVFKGGDPPLPCEAAGDVNCDSSVTSSDIIYLVNHVFKSADPPCDVCDLVPGVWACP
jgi:hypothetical protein